MKRDTYNLIFSVIEREKKRPNADAEIVTRDGRIIPQRTCTRQQFEEWLSLLHEASEQAKFEYSLARSCGDC
jgi:hypothetical protein